MMDTSKAMEPMEAAVAAGAEAMDGFGPALPTHARSRACLEAGLGALANNLPREMLEAAARALCESDGADVDEWIGFYKQEAEAALRAALAQVGEKK